MKERRITGSEVIIDSIVALAQSASLAQHESKMSISLDFALTELVRGEMRLMAQDNSQFGRSDDFLRAAFRRVTTKVETALDAKDIRLDLHEYEKQLIEKLRFPAKEIQTLGEKLAQSRRSQKLGAKEELAVDGVHHFIVHELGLREAIHGLLVEPTAQVTEINVAALREQKTWRVEGEWFPYEVVADDFVFVIDDDGSIFVSTVNLPGEIVLDIRRLIGQLAKILYK